MAKHEPAGERRVRSRRGPAGRRIGLLLGTAALGAVGFSLISPAAPPANISAAAAVRDNGSVLAERSAPQHVSRDAGRDATAIQALNDPELEKTRARGRGDSAAARDRARAQALAAAQFSCLDLLWERESNWWPNAQNQTSTAYGIAQLLDTTWAVTGVTKTSNGFRQIDAGSPTWPPRTPAARARPGGTRPASAGTEVNE